eukprot:TRINITY_DN17368_c0_g1_i1.p1 TRINITY_DN17368_c0_g1~~TRINITY_DN17368_c0_g1_i1.p1  ORF type:complete len:722 (-),score=202.60 TRINITY_DN17368_c0_g1_i1:241-2406(-)
MATRVTTEVGHDEVMIVTMHNPPVNALAPAVLKGLKEAFDEAHHRHDVKAIVVTGANGRFSGGFDISAIVQQQERGEIASLGDVSTDLMIKTVESGPKPAVAAIEGLALGGGLELAMSCHARLSAPKAQLGLPELTLGIIPGFGGTQRLPRLTGLAKAVEMMLLSKPIKAEEGKELGLIDEIVPPNQLLSAARKVALDLASGRRPLVKSLERNDKIEELDDALEIIKFARKQARATAPNVNHPQACLDAVEAGVRHGGYEGNRKEAEVFKELVLSDTSKALTHVFFAQRATTKVAGVTDKGLKPRPIRSVAIIGGGLMGSGIATALVLAGIPVLLKEVNQDFLQAGVDRIAANLKSRVKKGSMTEDKYSKTMQLVKPTLEYKDFNGVDAVIEAVIEDIGLKQNIFADLEKHCSPHALLATNTSTIDINLVGKKTNAQDRIIGAHFFSPAHVMPLLEIVRTDRTSNQAIVDLLTLGKTIKKTPVVVGNCTGFAVNRVFFPYTMAASLLVDLGVDPYRIDKVIKSFGMPMGPFRLADLVGMQVAYLTGKQYLAEWPDRTYGSKMIQLLFDDKRFGERTKKGFYVYDDKRKNKPDPELQKYVEQSRKAAGLMPEGRPLQVSDQEIVEMIFFPVVNEASRVLQEQIVQSGGDLDIASVLSMGFPPYRGGVVWWGDSIGVKYVHEKLSKWSQLYGGFFKPSAFLAERASKGVKLAAPLEDSPRSRL